VQLERLAREGSTKIASRNDKPEDVLTNYQGNWLGWVDLITGLAVRGGKGEKAAVTCAWLQPESKLDFV